MLAGGCLQTWTPGFKALPSCSAALEGSRPRLQPTTDHRMAGCDATNSTAVMGRTEVNLFLAALASQPPAATLWTLQRTAISDLTPPQRPPLHLGSQRLPRGSRWMLVRRATLKPGPRQRPGPLWRLQSQPARKQRRRWRLLELWRCR
jgi:hypothetical protein